MSQLEALEVGRKGKAFAVPLDSIQPMEREALASLSPALPDSDPLTLSSTTAHEAKFEETFEPPQSDGVDTIDQLLAEGLPLTLKRYKEEVNVRVRFSMRAIRDLEKKFGSIENVGLLLTKLLNDKNDDEDVEKWVTLFEKKLNEEDLTSLRTAFYLLKGEKSSSFERVDPIIQLLSIGLAYDVQTGNPTKWREPETLIDWLDFSNINTYILVLEAALLLAVPKFRSTVRRPQLPTVENDSNNSPIVGIGEPQESTSESNSMSSGT